LQYGYRIGRYRLYRPDKLPVVIYRIHISECIDRIHSYIGGMDESTFKSSELTQDAVLRNLQILSESTQRVDNLRTHTIDKLAKAMNLSPEQLVD
jgi:uncharacterized protein with HEPN domain